MGWGEPVVGEVGEVFDIDIINVIHIGDAAMVAVAGINRARMMGRIMRDVIVWLSFSFRVTRVY